MTAPRSYCFVCAVNVPLGHSFCEQCVRTGPRNAAWWFYQWVREKLPEGDYRLSAISKLLREVGARLTA